MTKLSVLVPIYNTSKFLVQCLESLKKQTLDDIEFICINDGSTDNSLEILTNYVAHDSRFKVISKKNSGYGHTMNVGIQNASGEYVGIVESDDFVEPEMFKKLYETAKIYNADLIKSNYWTYTEGEDRYIKPLENGPYNKVFTPCCEEQEIFLRGQSIWSAIYRRDLIQGNNIRFLETPGASYQDTSFYFITMACANRVVLIEDAYLHYRQDNPNSSVKSTGKVYCVCDEFKAIWDFIKERQDLKECVKYILPEFQWNVYQWNMSRLEERYKYDFLERMYDEFKELDKMKVLKRVYWKNKSSFDKMKKIDQDKDNFLYTYYLDEQVEHIYRNAFINEIQRYRKVFVYGAGAIAKSVIGLLEKYNIYINKVVVTSTEDNPLNFMGYVVFGRDELTDDEKRKGIFLIAVKESNQYHIIRELQGREVQNIIAVSNELRKSLMS